MSDKAVAKQNDTGLHYDDGVLVVPEDYNLDKAEAVEVIKYLAELGEHCQFSEANYEMLKKAAALF